jgi:hypothetical protein
MGFRFGLDAGRHTPSQFCEEISSRGNMIPACQRTSFCSVSSFCPLNGYGQIACLTGSTLRPRSVEEKGSIARALHKEVWPLIESRKVRTVIHAVLKGLLMA